MTEVETLRNELSDLYIKKMELIKEIIDYAERSGIITISHHNKLSSIYLYYEIETLQKRIKWWLSLLDYAHNSNSDFNFIDFQKLLYKICSNENSSFITKFNCLSKDEEDKQQQLKNILNKQSEELFWIKAFD